MEILEQNFWTALLTKQADIPFQKYKHDEQAWITPVEKSGPGRFFGDLDLQQAWLTPMEKLKFLSPFGTI